MFGSTKAGHMAQIVSTALLGQVVSSGLTPPDPSVVENYGHLIIQALVALVTIWATVRKALQKPQVVGPGTDGAGAPPTSGTGVSSGSDGSAE